MHAAVQTEHHRERGMGFAPTLVDVWSRLAATAVVSRIWAALRRRGEGMGIVLLASSLNGLSGRRILDARHGAVTMAVAPAECVKEGLLVEILVPRRAPVRVIEPASERRLRSALAPHPVPAARGVGRSSRIGRGFPIPQVVEIGCS